MESNVGPIRTLSKKAARVAKASPYVPHYMRPTKAFESKKRRQPRTQTQTQQAAARPASRQLHHKPVRSQTRQVGQKPHAKPAAPVKTKVQPRAIPPLKAHTRSKPAATKKVVPPKQPARVHPQPASSQSQPQKGGRAWSLSDFKMGRRVGRGVMADVYIAKEKASDRVVAIKAISRRTISTLEEQFQTGADSIMKQIKREIEIHSHTRHANILRMYGYFYDDKNIYLVLEYAAEGELRQALKDQPDGKFVDEQVASFAKQVASALAYLHSKGVLHRDLKSENLLLMKDGTLRLNDFGWAVHSPKMDRTTFCGTLDYLPPEIVREEPYSKSADMWSLGVLIYELLTGVMPFETENPTETYSRILQPEEHLKYPDDVTDDARDIISRLLVVRPAKRLSPSQVLDHPWIKRATQPHPFNEPAQAAAPATQTMSVSHPGMPV